MIVAEVSPGLHLDSRRALWIAGEGALVVADAHWGYAATHRAAGNLLPVWGDEQLESTLDALFADHAPAQVIFLGDVVHGRAGRTRAAAYLSALALPATILRGNHDRDWIPPGTILPSLAVGGCFLHHGDQPLPPNAGKIEIVGHHHPAYLHRDGAGSRLKLPAAVVSSRRVVLPAFSPWAAGTPWNGRLAADETLWAVASRRVFPVPPDRLFSSARW